MLVKLIQTLLIAIAGGACFSLLHIPLPWMLGPLTLTMLWHSFLKGEIYWPIGLRDASLVVLGFMMGASFTPETAHQIVIQLPSMLLATTATALFSLFTGYLIHHQTGISLASGLLGSIPGGLTQVAALLDEFADTDPTIITFMQTFRLLSVVFIIPFVVMHGLAKTVEPLTSSNAGIDITLQSAFSGNTLLFIVTALLALVLAKLLRLPTPYMLGPLLAVAVLQVAGGHAPAVPSPLIVVAQLCIGTYLGSTFDPASLKNWQKLLPCIITSNLAVLSFSFAVAYLLTLLHPIQLSDAFLSTAPGGLAEMGLTAVQVHGNLALITAYQIFRLLFILLVVPLLLKWRLNKVSERGCN